MPIVFAGYNGYDELAGRLPPEVTGVASETGIDFDASTKEERSWIKADVVLDKPIRFEQLEREIHRLVHG